MGVDSAIVLAALADKHAKHLFVPECHTGSAHTDADCRRLDAWVLERTWSPPTTRGYEIKVSRQDFVTDTKWVAYLPYCHHFAFACPAGLIRAEELPDGVGLLWLSNSGRLHTRRPSVRREPEPEKLLRLMSYVLMSRSVVVADMWEANKGRLPDSLARYRKEIELAERCGKLATFVRGHVREHCERLAARAEKSEELHRQAMVIVQQLAKRGFHWDTERQLFDWVLTKQVDQLCGVVDVPELTRILRTASLKLDVAIAELSALDAQPAQKAG